jgi:hypothetical protein
MPQNLEVARICTYVTLSFCKYEYDIHDIGYDEEEGDGDGGHGYTVMNL